MYIYDIIMNIMKKITVFSVLFNHKTGGKRHGNRQTRKTKNGSAEG